MFGDSYIKRAESAGVDSEDEWLELLQKHLIFLRLKSRVRRYKWIADGFRCFVIQYKGLHGSPAADIRAIHSVSSLNI